MEAVVVKTKLVSSLVKVMPKRELTAVTFNKLSALRGEVVAFQIAYFCEKRVPLSLSVAGDDDVKVEVFDEGLVPCTLPAPLNDDYVITHEPGVFPDPLQELPKCFLTIAGRWRALWVRCRIAKNAAVGKHTIAIRMVGVKSLAERYGVEIKPIKLSFELNVLAAELPEQKLNVLNWFHSDCISTVYKTKPWSQKFWALLEKYFRNMVDHGCNSLLTPLWSSALDVMPDKGERPTAQLLDIECKAGKYTFDFSKLEKWLDLGLKCGVKNFEMAHFFTQWGAKATPKVMVRENGKLVKKFGWHVAADSAEYTKFIKALLPPLQKLLLKKGLKHRCFFHISDEPNADNAERYAAASKILRPLIDEKSFDIIDALSDVNFFKRGLIAVPIPGVQHIDDFAALPEWKRRWTYYCCGSAGGVPNRFFGLPSLRNRVLGVLLYVYDIEGFLQWGFNFWYSQFSIKQPIDPYMVTDAGGSFAAGDPFQVYPGDKGPVDSLHYEVFREAMQDLRALQLLEKKIGRAKTLQLVRADVGYDLQMGRYPHDDKWLLNLRERVNAAVAEK